MADSTPPEPLPGGHANASPSDEQFALTPGQRAALARALLELSTETASLSAAIQSLAMLLIASEQGNPPPTPTP